VDKTNNGRRILNWGKMGWPGGGEALGPCAKSKGQGGGGFRGGGGDFKLTLWGHRDVCENRVCVKHN